MTGVRIERAEGPTDEVRALVSELDAELSQSYPPEQRHGLKIDAIFQPHVRFFVAHAGDAPVGCGGVALFDDFAEVKRMYVRPAWRGKGVADAIMDRLMTEAAGHRCLRLETGSNFEAATRFYRRHGFAPCAVFGAYAAMPAHAVAASLFMERRL